MGRNQFGIREENMNKQSSKDEIIGSLREVAVIDWRFQGPGPVKVLMQWFHIWHEKYGWSYEEMQECVDEISKTGAIKRYEEIAENTDNESIVVEIIRNFFPN
ncbi:MAG: hypothetical protein GX556_08950 [Fibrobacter sp.]|nr:hypothetical protein [Fibrobacter sp.]